MHSNLVGVRGVLRRVTPLLAVASISLSGTVLFPVVASATLNTIIFSSVQAGKYTSCALSNNHSLYCWGDDHYNKLQDGGTAPSLVPIAIDLSAQLGGDSIVHYANGNRTVCVVSSSSKVWCWGYGHQGQLGNGSFADSTTPVQVSFPVQKTGFISQIAGTDDTFCSLTTTSQIWCWGSNNLGALGDNGTLNSDIPVLVVRTGVLASKVITTLRGDSHTYCVIDTAGHAYCWGDGSVGALGNGVKGVSTVPVAVTISGTGAQLAGKTLTQITPTLDDTCALDTLGEVFCWGSNNHGNLGLGLPDGLSNPSSIRLTPQRVTALTGKTVSSISSSGTGSCVTIDNGSIYCWGGEPVGDGSLLGNALTPELISGGEIAGKTVAVISSADYSACAADTDGSLYCWGNNDQGQNGDGTILQSAYPEEIAISPNASTTATVPGSPVGAAAVATNQAIQISWTDPLNDGGDPISGYTARASDGTNTFACTASGASATTCTIHALTNGTSYAVTLVATNAVGDSSVVHIGRATPSTVPDAPTLITATPGIGQIVVTWSAGVSNGGSVLTGFTASATLLAATTTCVASGPSATSCTIVGLVNGSTYHVSVISTNIAGSSLASNALTATPANVPTAPPTVTVTPQSQAVQISWAVPVSNGGAVIMGYTVTASPGNKICTTTTLLTCTISSLVATTGYTFAVRAQNWAGLSAPTSSMVVYPFAPSTLTIEVATPILSKGVAFTVILAGSVPKSVATVTMFNAHSATCTFNSARQCTVSLNEPLNGAFRIVAKVGIHPATFYVWVPKVISPVGVHHGNNAAIHVIDCPVGGSVTIALSDGRQFTAKASLGGAVVFLVPMKKVGTVTITTKVNGTAISPTNQIKVS